MNYVVILIIVIAVAMFLSSLFVKKRGRGFVFNKKKYFFSEAEKKFYLVLKQVADKNNLVIFPHVRLRDIFYASGENRFFDNNRINQKHIDFLLCDNSWFSPVIAIELDDSSHFLQKRQERDEFVDKLFNQTGLPLLRIKAAANYDINFLEQEILQKIKK